MVISHPSWLGALGQSYKQSLCDFVEVMERQDIVVIVRMDSGLFKLRSWPCFAEMNILIPIAITELLVSRARLSGLYVLSPIIPTLSINLVIPKNDSMNQTHL